MNSSRFFFKVWTRVYRLGISSLLVIAAFSCNKQSSSIHKSTGSEHLESGQAIQFLDSLIKAKGIPVIDNSKEVTFRYRNNSSRPLKIIAVKPSYPGVTASYNKDPVLPEHIGELKIKIQLSTDTQKQQEVLIYFENYKVPYNVIVNLDE